MQKQMLQQMAQMQQQMQQQKKRVSFSEQQQQSSVEEPWLFSVIICSFQQRGVSELPSLGRP